ncbi:alpha-(1,3)-fucosyltransferase 4-like [Chanos chanos]|uniref:Fucosyltransferase n=1 Tax=Chanos chanos TaxID=29144 RepID=A0A6J2VL73_CHACN|nr:alpha-(1,3)-fucosyltransferase 4-like [Chanos chanos]
MDISSTVLAKQTHRPPGRASRRHCEHQHKQCRVVAGRANYPRVFGLALGCLFLLLLLSLKNLPLLVLDMPSLTMTGTDTEPPPVTLLIWWLPFGNKYPMPDCASNYGIRGCTVTADRDAYAQADAVIIHNRELMSTWHELPEQPRPSRQKWIWMNFESPSHSGWLEEYDGVFNLTMSYRRGSDIFLPYGYLQPRHRNDPHETQHAGKLRFGRKRRLVAWIISNWNENQERVQFYRQLSRYLRVDIYGRSGWQLFNDSVIQTVAQYKFYLAFENSVHTDYITEKLWRNALLAGAVPVVLGPPRENYERFLPADAFIHVNDFRSPRRLAAYLKHLDRNPSLYSRYLAWRRDYTVHVTSFWTEHYCTACRAVQASQHQTKTVTHLALWYQA